uniref:Low-density lipoprotein receptor-related protein 6 n=1 Tax=Magallana gigas TaxID=29159 RepID=K1R3X5_MAGGI
MAVDFTTNRLYWADILFHKLESIGLNGMDRKITLYDDRLMGAVSIALFEDKIYWTNPSHGVYSANKFTGRDVQEELSEMLSIASLIIMHPMLQNEEIKVSFQVPRVYFGARKQIQQFPLLSVGYQDNLIGTVIEENIKKISSLDVSHKHGILVYSDIQRDVIARVNISDDMGFSNEKIVYSKDLHSVEKLQLDAVTGNIYWVDVGKKTVEVASLNGEYHRVLIPSSHFVQRLTSLAVAVMTGHLYLSLVGVHPTILSCTLDGISCLPLSVNVYHPNDIVLYEGRLYIADGDYDAVQILSVEVPDGGYRKVHWQGYNRDLTRMAIYNDVLYWTEDKGTSLFSVSLRNNQDETIVLHDIIPLSSIVIWNPKLTVVENACSRNNGGCSHLCLPVSQNSRVCACSDGFLLQKDNTSCIGGVFHQRPFVMKYLIVKMGQMRKKVVVTRQQ